MNNDAEKIIKKVADEKTSEKNAAEKNIQLVVFELDKEEYAVEITDLQEIKKMTEITPIPNAPLFIRGIFNLRGKIIVVVDLEKRFNLVRDNARSLEENLIIAEVNENSFGVIVDRVTEIINIGKSSIQAAPALVSSKIHADYIKGVVVLQENSKKNDEEDDSESRLIIMLDLMKMLQEKELLSLSEVVQKAINN